MKLLIVDDNKLNQKLMGILVKNLSFVKRVDIAGSGREALEHYEQMQHDLVLLDIQMPEMNGYEVLTRLKNYEKKPKVYAISAMDQNQIDKVFEHKFDGFIPKPIQITNLRDLLKSESLAF